MAMKKAKVVKPERNDILNSDMCKSCKNLFTLKAEGQKERVECTIIKENIPGKTIECTHYVNR